MIFIPKAGKDDYTIPKAFIPVSLTSTILKVLERVILNELELTTFKENPICCDSALSDMVDNIEKSIMKGEYAVGVFLDIAGAFDDLVIPAAVRAMTKSKLPPLLKDWYHFYLTHRVATAELMGCTTSAMLEKGAPQGGVLSPVIWNISFDEFLYLFKSSPIRALGYAAVSYTHLTLPTNREV